MAENLFCKKQKTTTPAFREGWERTFNRLHFLIEEMAEKHEKKMQKDLERKIWRGK